MMAYNILFDISFLGLVFFTSLLLSLLFIPVSSKVALRLNVLDLPDDRKIHDHPLPRMGGIAIAVSFFLAIVMCLKITPQLLGYILGGGTAVFIGLLDDKFYISPKIKFVGEIVAAAIFILVSNTYLTGLGNLFGWGEVYFGSLGPLFTVFCMVGVMNALNLSDGLDGLAAGISVVSLIFLAILAYEISSWYVLTVIVALFGSVIGFLRFNNHPARLFMGDTGSLLLGFALGAIAVDLTSGQGGENSVAPVTLAVILGVPIVDTLYVMGRRLIKGLNPFHPDKTHLHHRLLRLGLLHSEVVAIIYALTIFFCFLGWSIMFWPDWAQFYFGSGCFVLFYILLHLLENTNSNYLISRFNTKIGEIKRRDFVSFSGRTVKYVQPLFLLLFLLPSVFVLPVNNVLGLLCFSIVGIIAILYPWQGGKRSMPLAYGIMFLACFYLLIVYHFNYQISQEMFHYLNILSILAFFWVAFRILFHRYDKVLLPSSFEILLIGFSWFIPIVLGSTLDISPITQKKLFWACLQAIPLLGLIKLTMRNHARRNRGMALSFVIVFLFLGSSAYLM